jgi:hypothetical protein
VRSTGPQLSLPTRRTGLQRGLAVTTVDDEIEATRLAAQVEIEWVRTVVSSFPKGPDSQRVRSKLARWLRRLEGSAPGLRLVLYGRTKAGKSTLAEALTGGSGSTIGKGRQRTTRTPRTYRRHGLVLVDAPGVGAYAGSQDQARARKLLGEADATLFVVTDDGIPSAVFEELAAVRTSGTPVLFVLNIKDNLEFKDVRADWLRDPERKFRERGVDDLRADLVEQARSRLGIPEPEVFHLHALAAFEQSRGADELAVIGRLDELEALVAREASTRARPRRIRAVLDGASQRLGEAREQAAADTNELDDKIALLDAALKSLTAALRRYARETPSRVRHEVHDQVMSLADGLAEWLDEHVDEAPARLQASWEQRAAECPLVPAIEDIAAAAIEQLRSILDDTSSNLEADLAGLADAMALPEPDAFRSGPNWQRLTKIGKWTLRGATFVPGPNQGIVIGLRVGAFAGAEILRRVGRRLPARSTRRQQHISELERTIVAELESLSKTLTDQLTAELLSLSGVGPGRTFGPDTPGGSRVHELKAELAECRQRRTALLELGQHLEGATHAIDERLLNCLAETVAGVPALELLDRRRGDRFLVRGRLPQGADSRLATLLDEQIEIAPEIGSGEQLLERWEQKA